jgi:hypothetical protein
MFSKFFDNMGPLPHHIHHDDAHAGLVGESGSLKCNSSPPSTKTTARSSRSPSSAHPGSQRSRSSRALQNFAKGDNHLLELSAPTSCAWTPAGTCRGGSARAGEPCTYEPQFASDVYQCTRASSTSTTRCRRTSCERTVRRTKRRLRLPMEVIDWTSTSTRISTPTA